MKGVKATIGGNEYVLIFNGQAMFEIEDIFKSATEMVNAISKPGGDGFEALCKASSVLAEQGELVRRYYGYEAMEIPSEEWIRMSLQPIEVPKLKTSILNSVVLGFKKEVSEKDDVDLDLIEITQKKTST